MLRHACGYALVNAPAGIPRAPNIAHTTHGPLCRIVARPVQGLLEGLMPRLPSSPVSDRAFPVKRPAATKAYR
jgi:hypothetical protein